MNFPKTLLLGAVLLFTSISVIGYFKKEAGKNKPLLNENLASSESARKLEKTLASPVVSVPVKNKEQQEHKKHGRSALQTSNPVNAGLQKKSFTEPDDFPSVDRIIQLFTTGPTKLPIVETIAYSSSVPWLKGRPAWIADYAVYYSTSRHFIARSLNGCPDYFTQKITQGNYFNVFRKDKKVQFHLLVDVSRLKMGFYYVDLDTNERVLLKTYNVGLGRIDSSKPSGTLTPLGSYSLGDKVAVYTPGIIEFFKDQKTEMIRIFGSRWIPFGEELEGCTDPAKGYGIHGVPWIVDPQSGKLIENRDSINAYDSDGSIRLLTEDMDELFAIVITKPTFIHIVKDFHEAKLPGVEVGSPTR